MIGSVHKIIPKHFISTQPEEIILSPYYRYNPSVGYEITDTIKPGEGYWVKCSSPGTVIFPFRPNLISPENNAANTPQAIIFTWQSLICAISYHIQVATDSLFNNIILEDSTLSVTSKDLCNLGYANSYYWRVRGYCDNAWSRWSVVWKFQTLQQPDPISDEYALFTLNNEFGLRLLDPNRLVLLDSLSGYFPSSTLEFSSGDSIWYMISRTVEEEIDSLIAVDSVTKEVLLRRESYPTRWVMDKDKRYLINQFYDTLTFIDRLTFQLVKKENISMGGSIPSPIRSELYCFNANRGITVYDIDSFKVDRHIPINDNSIVAWHPRDLNISHDGRYLYLTVSTNYSLRYQGTFYVIDLLKDSVISKNPCGRLARISVSPDGNFVYLSDPLPISGDYIPIGEVLRYNVNTCGMEIYLKLNYFPGITIPGNQGTRRVIVSPDSRSIFVLLSHYGNLCNNGQQANLLKVDVESKNIVSATYFYWMYELKFGKHIK